jgi:hypothetical protein
MSFVMTTSALASSSASTASAPYVGTGGWGRIGFAASSVFAEDDNADDVAKNPTITNGAVSSVSLSTGSYHRRHFYGGGGAAIISNVDEDDDDDTDSEDDDDDDDSSLEDLQPRGGGSSTIMGIQAWPGRRSLYDDFAGADDHATKKDDEDDDGIERLAASHMLLSTVFRHGGGGGGDSMSNSSTGVVRVVSNDDDDDDIEEVGDGDDAALAEKWEKQLRQNYQKEQQWQRLLAAMGDSGAANGNGKVLDLSTIVEEEDDDDRSTADHPEDHITCARSVSRRGISEDDIASLLAFDDQVLCRRDDDVGRSNKEEAVIGAEKDSAWYMPSQRDDGIEDDGGVDHPIDNVSTAVASAQRRDAGGHQDDNREPLWLQLPGILPRIHTRCQSDPHDLAGGTAQCDVSVGAACEAVERGAPPHVELLQKTLDCIAALAFCG